MPATHECYEHKNYVFYDNVQNSTRKSWQSALLDDNIVQIIDYFFLRIICVHQYLLKPHYFLYMY